jgi:hypothetical protein
MWKETDVPEENEENLRIRSKSTNHSTVKYGVTRSNSASAATTIIAIIITGLLK